MKNRKAIFIDGLCEYTLVQQENLTMLYYSQNDAWTNPGEFILGIEDTGNEFKIIGSRCKKGKLDYAEAERLFILLSAVKESKIEIFEKTGEI